MAEACNGVVRTFEINPGDFGLNSSALDHLRGGDTECNARVVRDVLSGSRRDEARALVIMTSAAALLVGDLASDLREAAECAAKSIDSGAAEMKLSQLIKATNLT